jgi:hypothetical protein
VIPGAAVPPPPLLRRRAALGAAVGAGAEVVAAGGAEAEADLPASSQNERDLNNWEHGAGAGDAPKRKADEPRRVLADRSRPVFERGVNFLERRPLRAVVHALSAGLHRVVE